jgi:hypothetical protein
MNQQESISEILGDVESLFGHGEKREEHQLERIADALECICQYLHDLIPTQPSNLTGVNLMALPTAPVAPGATGDFTATAVGADGTTVDANATVDVVSSDVTIFTVAGSSAAGVFTGTWTAVADGAYTVTGTGTDGATVVTSGTDNPASGSVATPLAAVNFA